MVPNTQSGQSIQTSQPQVITNPPQNLQQSVVTEPPRRSPNLILRFLGFIVFIILVAVGIYSYFYFTDDGGGIKNLRLTNLTSNSITITWTTDEAVFGKVIWGEDNNFYPFVENINKSVSFDDRDVDENESGQYVIVEEGMKKRFTHSITIRDLDPEKQYFFKIGSDKRYFNLTSFRTLSLLEDINTPEALYGKAINEQNIAVDDALVYYRVSSAMQTSLVYSTTTNAEGGYAIDVGYLRDESGNYFRFNPEAKISLEIIAREMGGNDTFTGENMRPASDIILGKDYQSRFWSEEDSSSLIMKVGAQSRITVTPTREVVRATPRVGQREGTSCSNDTECGEGYSCSYCGSCPGYGSPRCIPKGTSCIQVCGPSRPYDPARPIPTTTPRMKIEERIKRQVETRQQYEKANKELYKRTKVACGVCATQLSCGETNYKLLIAENGKCIYSSNIVVKMTGDTNNCTIRSESPNGVNIDLCTFSETTITPTPTPTATVTPTGARPSTTPTPGNNDFLRRPNFGRVVYNNKRYLFVPLRSKTALGKTLITKTNAQAEDSFTQVDAGVYEIKSSGTNEPKVTVNEDNVSLVFFEDTNGDNTKQESEEVVDAESNDIEVNKESEVITLNLNQGWNLVGFDVVSEKLTNASKVLAEMNLQTMKVTSISTFGEGKWQMYSLRVDEDGTTQTFGEDFVIIPGKGYFVKSMSATEVTLEGQKFTESVPLSLINGWNLVNIQSPNRSYKASEMLDKCTEFEVDCDSFARYDSGLYDIIVKDQGTLFGNDFNIISNSGYFIRVKSGGGKSITP